MRDIIFAAVMAGLIPAAMVRPFIGILVWSWLSFLNPHRDLWGFGFNQPWAQAIFIATLVGCVVAREPKRIPVNTMVILFLLLALHFTVTTLFGLGETTSAWAKWDKTMKVIAGLLLTAALLTDRHRIHALIWLMAISLGYYGIRGGLFTVITGGGFRVWGPADTMIADNNHLGTALLIAIPLMNYLRLQSKHRIIRWGLLATMVLTLFASLGTQSRGAFLALAAVTIVFWLRSKQKVIFGTLMAGVVAGAVMFMPESWVERMQTIQTYEEDPSATTRLVLWEVSYLLAADRPLLGAGFRGPYTREAVDRVMPGGPARAVHSIWFEVMGEHGFLGFALWLALTIVGVWYTIRLVRMAKENPELAWAGDLGRMAQVSMVAYCAGGTFLSLAYWDYYWTLLIVLGAAYAVARQTASQPQPGAMPAAAGWRMRAASAGVAQRNRPGAA
jgi:probable O-glycosylation ligase (exosortase A-associated)